MTEQEQRDMAYARAHIASLEAALELLGEELQQARKTACYYQDQSKQLCAQLAVAEFELLKTHTRLMEKEPVQ